MEKKLALREPAFHAFASKDSRAPGIGDGGGAWTGETRLSDPEGMPSLAPASLLWRLNDASEAHGGILEEEGERTWSDDPAPGHCV